MLLTRIEHAYVVSTRTIDAAVLRLERRQYEDGMRQAAYWRALALTRSANGLTIALPLRRAKYYLGQASIQRRLIDVKASQL